MRGFLTAVFVFSLGAATIGCAHRSRAETQTQLTYVNKPLIDFARGGGLPVDGVKDLHTSDDLLTGLTRGYRGRIDLPKDHDAIQIAGQFPQLDLLRIDVSDGTLKKDFKPKQFKKPSAPQAAVFVKHFEYIANPLRYHGGPMEWHVTARDAELSMVREGDQSSLVLTSVAEGSFQFSMKLADVGPMLIAASKEHSRGGFNIRDIHIDMRSEDARTLLIDVKVEANWLLLPVAFRIAGKAHIDDSFNVGLTGLRCDGLDIGGLLVAGFIEDALAKQNGKVMPLAQWPGNRIQLSGAKIELDDHIRIKASFGPPSTVAKSN